MICGHCKTEGVNVAHVRQCNGEAIVKVALAERDGTRPKFEIISKNTANVTNESALDDDRWYLSVPYDDRQEVKDLGGKFDRDKKKWYLPKSAADDPDIYDKMPVEWYIPQDAAELEDAIYLMEASYYMVYHTVHGANQQVAKKLVLSEEERNELSVLMSNGYEPEGDTEAHKWGTWTYIGKSPIFKLKPEMKLDAEESRKFGQIYGYCGRCGRTLTNEDSKKAGIGPVCAGKE